MTLGAPAWLLLALPAGLVFLACRPAGRLAATLRALALGLALLGLCAPTLRLAARAGTLVLVADRSLSMPPGAEASMRETAELLARAAGPDDRLAVVAFGRSAAVAQPAHDGKALALGGSPVGGDGSELAAGLDLALALIEPGQAGRILLVSDGKYTGQAPFPAAAAAGARGVAIDHRLVQRRPDGDLAVERFEAPARVEPGESYLLAAWIRSPDTRPAAYVLERDGAVLCSGRSTFAAGLTRLSFRDTAPAAGLCRYRLTLRPEPADSVPENESARALTMVTGPRPILHLRGAPGGALPELLGGGGLAVESRAPARMEWSLETLAGFSAVLLEECPAQRIGHEGMQTLAAWVREAGGGVLMTGGPTSFGPGGYYRSPLEPLLPVSMELRREHRKFSVAIVVALDRSGSMAASVDGGRTKMDLADQGAAEVLGMLSPMDQFGCLAVDSVPQVVIPLGPADQHPRGLLLSIESMGGGIFVYEALEAATRMLSGATAGARHIILFADAADAEEPGAYADLLARNREAGITCSVVALGSPADQDAELLRDVAARGGGHIYFAENAGELPRLFAQDTLLVARSAFLEQPTPFVFAAGMLGLAGRGFPDPPPLGGYNLCYLRPGALLGAVTTDAYAAPVIAAWHAALGRVACFMGQADGEHTGPLAGWEGTGPMLCSLARWAGALDQEHGDLAATQEPGEDRVRIVLHLDAARQGEPFDGPPVLRTLQGQPPRRGELPMQWTGPDELSAELDLGGAETLLAAIDLPGRGRLSLPPLCLPYSAEFRPDASGRGPATLARLSRLSGGVERLDLGGIWGDLPAAPRERPLRPWLLLAAALLVLAEVVERRTGILSGLRRVRPPGRAPVPEGGLESSTPKSSPRRPDPAPAPPEASAPPAAGVLDALDQARRRARDRMR